MCQSVYNKSKSFTNQRVFIEHKDSNTRRWTLKTDLGIKEQSYKLTKASPLALARGFRTTWWKKLKKKTRENIKKTEIEWLRDACKAWPRSPFIGRFQASSCSSNMSSMTILSWKVIKRPMVGNCLGYLVSKFQTIWTSGSQVMSKMATRFSKWLQQVAGSVSPTWRLLLIIMHSEFDQGVF